MGETNESINFKEEFICTCKNTEHQVLFMYDSDLNEVYMSVHLVPESNILERIWKAIKYIFGFISNYGHFDRFVFNSKDADNLQSIVNHLKNVSCNKTDGTINC